MTCKPGILKQVPLFARLDDDEAAMLASKVDLKTFAVRQRIYKHGDPGVRAYVLVSGRIQVTTIDEDGQEVVVNEPVPGGFFGFAAMLEQTAHQTDAIALEESVCIEVDRDDILALIKDKPHVAMDMLGVLGRQFHAAQELVRIRANRHPNELIEREETIGERVADAVAAFGGSWTFIFLFAGCLTAYTVLNVTLHQRAWDPYPFILLNLFLSMLAAVQAPVIMMSQNRQDKKDRLRGELDFDVNKRAHTEIQGLAHKINLLGDRLGDIEELLRGKVQRPSERGLLHHFRTRGTRSAAHAPMATLSNPGDRCAPRTSRVGGARRSESHKIAAGENVQMPRGGVAVAAQHFPHDPSSWPFRTFLFDDPRDERLSAHGETHDTASVVVFSRRRFCSAARKAGRNGRFERGTCWPDPCNCQVEPRARWRGRTSRRSEKTATARKHPREAASRRSSHESGGPMSVQQIAILTSGGDAPGMNAAIRAVTRCALAQGWAIAGVRHGFLGLIEGKFDQLTARSVGGILQRGGTILGSARCPAFLTEEGRRTALRSLHQAEVDALVVIGGNGSQTGAFALSQMGFPVVGVASTIDNDLSGSDVTIGVDTALNIALEAIDRLKITASSHQRAFLVEVMGRQCGYLALMAGIAGGAEVVVTPEVETTPDDVADQLRAAYEHGKVHALAVVAEGARYNAEALVAYFRERKEKIGFDVRSTTLGHVQRGGVPTAYDRLLATRLGAGAVAALARGESGVLVGMLDGAVQTTPLERIVGVQKAIDPGLLALARVLDA